MIGFGFMLAGIAVSWAGMIYGWGLTPVSWPWIVGSSAATLVLMGIGAAFAKS
jgi:hypothetical protein